MTTSRNNKHLLHEVLHCVLAAAVYLPARFPISFSFLSFTIKWISNCCGMFVLSEIKDSVRILPHNFNHDLHDAISNKLNKKLANKVVVWTVLFFSIFYFYYILYVTSVGYTQCWTVHYSTWYYQYWWLLSHSRRWSIAYTRYENTLRI